MQQQQTYKKKKWLRRHNYGRVVGDEFSYMNTIYKVIQSHTSQSDWLPSELPALYLRVSPEGVPEVPEIPEFVQPTGSHDAYNEGDRVFFESKIYESTMDNNTWSPSDYPAAWLLVS